ncbi:TPA: DUF4435 domain-containing protein [Stenotrophomonas maltophilia]|nr:DUF4435 domain-containing protein [Stenotrophomonas maltophilia]
MDRASQMREGRDSAATLKTKLSTLRSKLPEQSIIVLEGKDDVPVFEVWSKRVSEDFSWEPFVSKGKRNSIALYRLLKRDETGLSDSVFFILDHDYDGGYELAANDDAYVLPGYSIENFVASGEGLEFFMKTTLGLHSAPDFRTLAMEFFHTNLEIYCKHLLEPCAILWAARKSGVKGVEAKDAVIDYFEFSSAGIKLKENSSLSDLIAFDGVIDEGEVEKGRIALAGPDLSIWVRGKYVLSFFEKCCQVLHKDINDESPLVFPAHSKSKLENGSTSMARLAGAVKLPTGFREAIVSWKAKN